MSDIGNQSFEGGSTGNSQNVVCMRYVLVVLHHLIRVMITVIIRAKFEHMNIWNSFSSTYVMAFLIAHGGKRTWVQIDHFLCLLHLCFFCTTGRGIWCIANTLRGISFWLLFFTHGHFSFNYSCWVSGGTVYLCSLTVLMDYQYGALLQGSACCMLHWRLCALNKDVDTSVMFKLQSM